jgi:hypothetical protein
MKRPTDTGRSSESVDRVQSFKSRQRFIDVEFSSDADQVLREVRVNPPVAHSIRVGHRVAGDSLKSPDDKVWRIAALRQASMSLKLSRHVNCANAKQRNWSRQEKCLIL